MSYSNRLWLYLPVGLLLLLALLYSIFWRVEADMLAARLDRANGGEIMPGVVFAFAGKSVGGYPFRLDVVLSEVSFSHMTAEGTTAWRAEKLALHALTYGRDLYILEAAGQQSFEQPGEAGAPLRVFSFVPGVARASAILRDRHLARFDLDIVQPDGKDATQGADPARTFTAARAQLHFLVHPNDTIDVAMRVDEAQLGKGFHAALSGPLNLVDLRGQLVKGNSLSGLENGAANPSDAAEQWRQAGGQFAVQKLSLDWAGVKTELSGTLGLDGAHHPNGTLTGSFDPAQILGALSKGSIKLPAMGQSPFSLTFKDGDIKINSAFLGGFR